MSYLKTNHLIPTKKILSGAIALALSSTLPALPAFAQDKMVSEQAQQSTFNIPAQNLASALRALSVQSHSQISVSSDLVENLTSNEVNGRFTVNNALEQMLKGSDLSITKVGTNSYTLKAKAATNDAIGINDKIVVTATRMAQDISSLPYTVQLIEKEEIQRQVQAGRDLGNILDRMIPGLAPGDNSVSSYYQSLRGRSILVLVDGVAQRANRNVSRQLTSIAPSNIERIEVVNGATSIYGAGATGGIINIITKRAKNEDVNMTTSIGFSTSTEELGSDSHNYSIAQTVSGMTGDLSYLFSGSYEQRGSFFDTDGEQIATDPNQVSRDNSHTLDILMNLDYQIDSQKTITLGARHLSDKMDSEYAADFGQASAATLGLPQGLLAAGGAYTPQPIEGLNLDQQPETATNSISLAFNDQELFGQNFIAQLNYRSNEAHWYPYPSTPLYLGINWDNVLTTLSAVPPAEVPSYLNPVIFSNISGASASLLQSKVTTKVIDLKFAFDTDIQIDSHKLNLIYGMDYIHDNGKQTSNEYDYNTWLASGLTEYQATNNTYSAGPEATTQTAALFLQAQLELTDALSVSAGLRHEQIKVEVDDYLSGIDQVNANYYNNELTNTSLQYLAGALGMEASGLLELATNGIASAFNYANYIKYSDEAVVREGGNKNYSATLANLGATYKLSQDQEVYANASQGFTVPDMTRLLRSVNVLSDLGNNGPILDATNIEPIKTNSVDLGWRLRENTWDVQASIFYNQSDQNINFNSVTGVVTIIDQKEKVKGFELSANGYLPSGLTGGVSYAYTAGHTYDVDTNEEVALGVERIAPKKLSAYVGYTSESNYDVRLQLMNLADYSDANEDKPTTAVDFKGYTMVDLLASYKLDAGKISVNIHNLANEDYMPLYNQVRGYPALGASAYLPGQGRTLSVNYSISY
jgi:iron complex outermembrane receptor protein